MHDASEAYLVDMPSPVKMAMPKYKEFEENMMRIIAEKFGFEFPLHPEIKKADEIMLQFEWHNLMVGNSWTPATSEEARITFLGEFNRLKLEYNINH